MAATLFKMRAGKAPPPLFPCIGHKGACAGRLVPPQRTVRAWGIWLWGKKCNNLLLLLSGGSVCPDLELLLSSLQLSLASPSPGFPKLSITALGNVGC